MRAYTAKRKAEGRPIPRKPKPRSNDPRVAGYMADLLVLVEVAEVGDSEVTLAERLAGRPSSTGPWHKIKVHRRLDRMRRDIEHWAGPVTPEMRRGPGVVSKGAGVAGDVVHRWAVLRALQD